MNERFPLLNGETINREEQLDTHFDVDHRKPAVARRDYVRESLEDWETYQTDSGPASPTYDGFASGGLTTITLSTGAGTAGDATEIQGPQLQWSEWTEIRAYLWGMEGDTNNVSQQLVFGDDPDPSAMTEGFFASIGNGVITSNNRYDARVVTDGDFKNTLFDEEETAQTDTRTSVGFRIFKNESAGYSIDFTLNGSFVDGWPEQDSWPADTPLTFRHSVVSADGSDVSRTADGWLIEVIR